MRIGFILKDRPAPGIKSGRYSRNFRVLLYPVLLLFTLLMVLALMEIKYPYYFLQDDNRDFYLPVFVHNYESILRGELPLYNFHQFLGTPSLSSGQMAALYPVTYISVFLSKLVFNNYFAAVDIQVVFHLLVGALGFYYMLKVFGLGNAASFFGALTWSLNSFIIYSSNSWVIVAGIAAYIPWMVAFSIKLFNSPDIKILALLAGVRLLMFYTGHIQYFIYSVIFEVMIFAAYMLVNIKTEGSRERFRKALLLYILSFVCTTLLALPLLLPMWHQTTISAMRSERLKFREFIEEKFEFLQWLSGLILPSAEVTDQTAWAYRRHLNLSHIGYITLIFVFVSAVAAFWKKKGLHKTGEYLIKSTRIFLGFGILSLLWSSSTTVNMIVYKIPVLNRFRWPFKMQFYTAFFFIAAAASGMSFIIEKFNKKTVSRVFIVSVLALQILNFTVLYTMFPQRNFGTHTDMLPLQDELAGKLSDGRLLPVGFNIWYPDPKNITGFKYGTAPTLGFNYASLWGLYQFAGYDPLVPAFNQGAALGLNFDGIYNAGSVGFPLSYLRTWGVKWYVVDNTAISKYEDIFNNKNSITRKFADDRRTVYVDEKAKPLFYWEQSVAGKIADSKIETNEIRLTAENNQDDRLIINFLYNPFFKAYVDGNEAEIEATQVGQITIAMHKGIHEIRIKYSDPYFNTGCYISFAFMLLLAACGIWITWRNLCSKYSV